MRSRATGRPVHPASDVGDDVMHRYAILTLEDAKGVDTASGLENAIAQQAERGRSAPEQRSVRPPGQLRSPGSGSSRGRWRGCLFCRGCRWKPCSARCTVDYDVWPPACPPDRTVAPQPLPRPASLVVRARTSGRVAESIPERCGTATAVSTRYRVCRRAPWRKLRRASRCHQSAARHASRVHDGLR